MPSTEPLFHGLAVRCRDGDQTWLQVGQGKKGLVADVGGIRIKGKCHLWGDVESISAFTVQRSLKRGIIEMFFALIANTPGTQAGTFVSLLLTRGAFERTHRCGTAIEAATKDDDEAVTRLLMRLRESVGRSELLAGNE